MNITIYNCSREQEIKLLKARSTLNGLLAQQFIYDRIRNEKFTYTEWTSAAIADFLATNKDKSITVNVVTPTRWQRMKWKMTGTSVLGFESNGAINLYDTFLDSADNAELVGTLAHEFMHFLGFWHPVKNTDLRPNSVPYKVGNIAKSMITN